MVCLRNISVDTLHKGDTDDDDDDDNNNNNNNLLMIFRRIGKTEKSNSSLRRVCPVRPLYVHPHGTPELPVDRFNLLAPEFYI